MKSHGPWQLSWRAIFILVLTVLLGVGSSVTAQSFRDGQTPVGMAPGTPAGTYPLSGFENINLFNGGLDFVLPLKVAGGRGSAGYTIPLRIQPEWNIDRNYCGNGCGYDSINLYGSTWFNFNPDFTPGLMIGRQSSDAPDFGNPTQYCYPDPNASYGFRTQTLLSFKTPDGTEYEFVDQMHDGQPQDYFWQCQTPYPTPISRGTVWKTHDGTAATFISDSPISDTFYYRNYGAGPPFFYPTGYLMLKDGTRYRIVNGGVLWIRDRNGNKLNFPYPSVPDVTDSLNRSITFDTSSVVNNTYSRTITYSGFGGAPRVIKVWYTLLGNTFNGLPALRSDYSSLRMLDELFAPWDLVGDHHFLWNPGVVAAVELPDGRQYRLQYNPYGELARVVLPTGGAFEYDYAGAGYQGDSVVGGAQPWYPKMVYRRVVERRVCKDSSACTVGNALEEKTTYSVNTWASGIKVLVDHKAPNETVLSHDEHYFYDRPDNLNSDPLQPGLIPFNQGKEAQADVFAFDGTTLLRRVVNTWQNRVAPSWCCRPNDPVITQTLTTLADTGQVAKQTFAYDQYTNLSDTYEYDYGSGSPGTFIRRTHTDYVTLANYVNADVNPVLGAHLRNLPSQQWVSSDSAGNNKKSLSTFEYDTYSDDSRHKPLVPRSGITGLDASYSDPFYSAARGNLTGVTSFSNAAAQTGPITASMQYDIAGNVVATVNGLVNRTTISYSDSFCNGSTCGGTFTPNTFAYPTTNTSPIPDPTGQHASTTAMTGSLVYDFWTGVFTSATDPNNQTTSFQYNDALDRKTAVIRPTGGGRTDFEYGDTVGNLFVRTLTDLDTGRRTDSYHYFDALGRGVETRTYEDGGQYIATKRIPFAVQQDPDTGTWVRVGQSSNPYRPNSGEQPVWTTTFLDSLGRVNKVLTPDSAIARITYSGNTVTVTDQVGRQRRSLTDAVGRLVRVDEPDKDTGNLGLVSNPVQATYYDYDTLDDLIKVTQDNNLQSPQQPPRVFGYDSLKRLASTTNPENGTVNYVYDNAGNLTQKTDARGVVTTYQYDALNRNTVSTYSDNTPRIDRYFDGAINGRDRLWYETTTSTNNNALLDQREFSEYDALGRPLTLRQVVANEGIDYPYYTHRSYNLAGLTSSQTYPSGHIVTYNYDAAARLADKDSNNLAFTGNLGDRTNRTYSAGIMYSPWGGMTKEKYGTDTAIYNKLFYNSRGQLAEIRVSTSYTGPTDTTWDRGAIINSYSEQCTGICTGSSMTDNNGNLKKQQIYIPNQQMRWQQYEYDSLNRLLWAREVLDGGAEQWKQEFVYDRWGNRTVHQTNTYGVGIPKPNFAVSTVNNRLTAPAGYTVNYDDAGNLTTDTYTGAGNRIYDAENRMTQAWGGNNQWQYYSYDADGRRVRRKVNNVETWQVYGFDGELLAEYAAKAAELSPQKEYGYRNGQLLVALSITGGSGSNPFTFTEDPLVAGLTTIKAVHLTELRTAVDQARAHAGLSLASWAESVTTGVIIKASHITELRARLDEARIALGLSAATYTDPNPTAGYLIKAAHVQELRARTNETLTAGGSATTDIRWLVGDQLGTPRMIFDQSGSLATVSRHDYLPFGEELFAGSGGRTTAQGYTGGDAVRQQFTLQERDLETTLDYFNARYFSSIQGRFTTPDMFGGRRINPQTLNLYSYVKNNPLKYVDPSGNSPQDPRKVEPEPPAGIQLDRVIINSEPPPPWYKRAWKAIGRFFGKGAVVATSAVVASNIAMDQIGREEQRILVRELHRFNENSTVNLPPMPGCPNCPNRMIIGLPGPAGIIEDVAETGILAENVATAPLLAEQLSAEEAASVFTADGGLQPAVLQNSTEIVAGSELNNTAVVQELTKDGSKITDWAKYTTETFHSPGGGYFQVHFYYNNVTKVLNTTIDYKAVWVRTPK